MVKETDAKILNEPSVWAKDNEEATFFSGSTIPFIDTNQSSPEQTSTTQTYSSLNVGVTLRVKPKITPDEAVDMAINLLVSQEGPQVLGNTSTPETNTTTRLLICLHYGLRIGMLPQNHRYDDSGFPFLNQIEESILLF